MKWKVIEVTAPTSKSYLNNQHVAANTYIYLALHDVNDDILVQLYAAYERDHIN